MDPAKEFFKKHLIIFTYLFIKLILIKKIGKIKFKGKKIIQMFTRKKKSKTFPKLLVQKATIFFLLEKKIIVFFSLSHVICKEPVVGPYGHREEGKSFGSPWLRPVGSVKLDSILT